MIFTSPLIARRYLLAKAAAKQTAPFKMDGADVEWRVNNVGLNVGFLVLAFGLCSRHIGTKRGRQMMFRCSKCWQKPCVCLHATTHAHTPINRPTMPVLVPDANSSSGYRVEQLSIEVDDDLAKALEACALPSPDGSKP